jgi:hypothetical protein
MSWWKSDTRATTPRDSIGCDEDGKQVAKGDGAPRGDGSSVLGGPYCASTARRATRKKMRSAVTVRMGVERPQLAAIRLPMTPPRVRRRSR